jgi:hypothetical protein
VRLTAISGGQDGQAGRDETKEASASYSQQRLQHGQQLSAAEEERKEAPSLARPPFDWSTALPAVASCSVSVLNDWISLPAYDDIPEDSAAWSQTAAAGGAAGPNSDNPAVSLHSSSCHHSRPKTASQQLTALLLWLFVSWWPDAV